MTKNELYLTQVVRVVDVVFLGPLMIKAANNTELSNFQSKALKISGVLTIIFNGVNFLRNI